MACVLIVADPGRVALIERELAEPLASGPIEIAVGSGGDETIDLFRACKPEVAVVTATLDHGDPHSLIGALRSLVAPHELVVVVIGDPERGTGKPADVAELAPDNFVTWPLAEQALRGAVERGIEGVQRARSRAEGTPPPLDEHSAPPYGGAARSGRAGPIDRAALRARWEALADSIESNDDAADGEPAPLPPPVVIQPKRARGTDTELDAGGGGWNGLEAPLREPTLILRDDPRPAQAAPVGDTDDPLLLELDFAQELRLGPEDVTPAPSVPSSRARLGGGGPLGPGPSSDVGHGHDFARQLRAKMSMMAQRLFHADQGTARTVDVAPRHDHQTEIDLAALGEEPALGGGVTEIESRPRADEPQLTTAPGSWDTQVRERGVPDSGEVVRGVSDAALLLAKLFAQQTTGRLAFRRGDTEKVVAFDQGRPVFASSNEAGDRMGELLVREGKITASQYERCQSLASTSGRRMGEILVDVGYLKRRELLPAVRRHVEDIVFSMFAWDRGHYRITLDTAPSAERIRLSRHPASLILEGIRRKLDRSALEALIGPPSTVVEVRDRDRLGGIVTVSDLASEERAALGGLDGQADLASVARAASIDLADLLPLAWGLCVLGLATARRSELESPGENAALVGETDLAIDRERVHARWRLVSDADYFALLGVRRDATAFEIRRAYQAARRDFAADCFPTDLRRELAGELDDIANVLDEAFRVLRDDRLRNTYLTNLVE